jgi:PAS domain S-box-containing protein
MSVPPKSSSSPRASGDDLVYRSLFESAPGLYVVLDPHDYRVMAVSNTYLAMTMRTREELLGRVFFDVFPDDPDNPDASGTANLIASLEHVKATGKKDAMAVQKHPIVNPETGVLEDRYWTPSNSPVFGSEGELSLIIHSTVDVTEYVQSIGQPSAKAVDQGELSVMIQARELKRLNDELLESQLRLQAIFRDASLGIAATDLKGYFTDANEAYCRMLGYSLEELKKLNVLDLTHPEDRTRNLELREELKRGDRPNFVYEKRYITRSGDILWSRISASLLRNSQGDVTNLIAIMEDITSQKQSEATLRQARILERIGGKIARVGGWVVNYDENHRVHWAREVYEIFDWSGEQPPLLPELLKLYHPANRQQFMRALEDCENKGKAFDLELALVSFKGIPKWVRIAGEPELDDEGRVIRTLGAVQDITRHKAEQLRGQQLNAQLFSTLESMSDAFYLLGRDWLFLYMNSEAERILGVDRHAIIGRHIFDEFPFFKTSPAYEGFQKAFKTGEAYHDEFYWPLQKVWISISAYSSADTLAVYFRSTTAEKQLQKRIGESEQRLKYVTQAALDVVWDIDVPNKTIWFNEGLKKYGYEVGDELMPPDFWMGKIHPEDAERVLSTTGALLAGTGTEWSVRYRLRKANGKYAHLEDRGYIIRDAEGKAIRVVGGSSDITERLEMEEQLLQTQRLESVGQLTGGIAHDFNNLLTVILGNAQLLQEQLQDNPKLRNLTNIIDVAATRGANLTRHLLAFSRKQALQPATVDINKLLTTLKGMLSRTLGENIVIRNIIQEDLWTAFVDPNQLEVALLNLCINARDAMPDGGFVTLETNNVHLDQSYALSHSDVDPGDYVLITITDTGTGIPPDILDHVFEPFFTTKEKGKGTGLGLSTVFGFVKQSNGHINIYSEVGRGTTIRIYLPRSLEPSVARQDAAAPQVVVGGDELVLLVEDNELVRKFGHDLLKSLGYSVIAASDGRAALALLRERTDVKLLFTDVVMPGMGGHELAKQALAIHPGLKVLYTSGYTQDSMIHNGKLDKGVHLLEKPYNKTALAAKIREVLGGK